MSDMGFISDSRLKRESNLELLRVLAIFMVVLTHTAISSVGLPSVEGVRCLAAKPLTMISTEMLTECCVNLFVLISGYFGIKSSLRGAVMLVLQVVLSLQVVYWIAVAIGVVDFSFAGWKAHLNVLWLWFVAVYLMLYASAPLLNKYIKSMSKPHFAVLLIVFALVQFQFGWRYDHFFFNRGYSWQSFIFLYLLGRYMKIYPAKWMSWKGWVYMAIFVATTAVSVGCWIVAAHCGDGAWSRVVKLTAYNAPNVMIATVALFLFFTKLTFHSRMVNVVAAGVFSVYVCQSAPALRERLFSDPISELYAHAPWGEYVVFTLLIVAGWCVAGVAVGIMSQLIINALLRWWDGGCWLHDRYTECKKMVVKRLS